MNSSNQHLEIATKQLWPLFGNDYTQAAKTLRELLKEQPTHNQLLHLAISIGLYSEVIKIIKSCNLSNNTKGTLAYRLKLKNQDFSGALEAICTKESKELARRTLEKSALKHQPLSIVMPGTAGIGDLLESSCFIHNWQRFSQIKFIIYASKNRKMQLDQYYKEIPSVLLKTNKENLLSPFPFFSYKYWLQRDNLNYFQHPIIDFNKNGEKKGLLCCWGAQGAREPFSRYSRSVPFDLAYRFYTLVRNKKSCNPITDITEWNRWEKNSLAKIGVQCHDPSQSDVFGLAEMAAKKKYIVTIDTALAHLCAVSNIQAHLLLAKYPDERRNYLLQPNTCYSRNLNIHQQTVFGDWLKTVESMAQKIASEDF